MVTAPARQRSARWQRARRCRRDFARMTIATEARGLNRFDAAPLGRSHGIDGRALRPMSLYVKGRSLRGNPATYQHMETT